MRTVVHDELDGFFEHTYDQYVTLLFPDQPGPPAHIIQQVNYVNLLQAIFKSRVDHVYSRTTGVRPANRIPLVSNILIPRIIADVINGYGSLLVLSNSTIVVPSPAVLAQGVNPPAILAADATLFTSFMAALAHHNYVNLSNVSNIESGSASYTLCPTSVSFGRTAGANPVANAADTQSQTVYIRSWHPDFSPSDVLLAAVSVHGYTRNLLETRQWPWTADPVTDVNSIRITLASMY